jgi:hypothetical protein
LVNDSLTVQKKNHKQHIIGQLKPHYFWDVDRSTIDDTANKRLVIERVITYGTLGEICLIISNYGRTEVIDVIRKSKSLDPKTINFIAKFLEL